MRINRESFTERTLINLIMLMGIILCSTAVTFVTMIILNLPVTLYFGRFNWDLEDYVMLVLGLLFGLILVDKFRVWADKQ